MISTPETNKKLLCNKSKNKKDGDNDSPSQKARESIVEDIYDLIYYVLYFVGRYLVVITSNVICVIASLYATGSLVTLEATKFFCPSYTLEEIRQYNLENGNEQGTRDDSCLLIDRQGLNCNILFGLDNHVFTGKIDTDTLDLGAYLHSIFYFVLALILSISTLYQTYLLIYDTIYAIYSAVSGEHKNGRISHKLSQLDRKIQQSHDRETESPRLKKSTDKSTLKPARRWLCCCALLKENYTRCGVDKPRNGILNILHQFIMLLVSGEC